MRVVAIAKLNTRAVGEKHEITKIEIGFFMLLDLTTTVLRF